ncbi:hypothetical protein AB1Y20_009162 [Prymnesium parvum]|uniref:YchJ-like middle NTF2-like domain-containing protein n=1 Tax=Prymnesium parvum TaxID=97485 RepID=A0AB34K3Q4_PRYPA
MAFLVLLSLALLPPGTSMTRTTHLQMMARGKSPNPAAGGFGAAKAAPLSLDDVVATFPNRLPSRADVCCPCGTGDSYEACCQPYHLGVKVAETPERCLRSRYSAFCYRLPKYIISTTAKSNSDWQADKVKWARRLHKEQMFDSFEFVSLEIVDQAEGASEREALINMRVTLQPIDERTKLKSQVEPMVFAELSKFKQTAKGAWLYSTGSVTSEVAGLKGRTLNDDKDLSRLQKDVGFVEGVMNTPKN